MASAPLFNGYPLPPLNTEAVALGVGGGIAAYKACEAVRHLQQHGVKQVYPLLTAEAEAFVGALTFSSLALHPALTHSLGVTEQGVPWHIALPQRCQALLVLPTTANLLAQLAQGMAGCLLSATALSFTGQPMVLVPAMNTRMWHNPLTQGHVARLRHLGNVQVLEPSSGLLACGETGAGHLPPWEHTHLALYKALHPQAGVLAGQRVLVTAGGTTEAIDAARVLSNRSSGKMGLALADECYAMGAEVTLLFAGNPLPIRPYSVQYTPTVGSLQAAALALAPHQHWVFKAAAVSDFKMAQPHAGKWQKQAGQSHYTLELTLTPDILAQLGATKPPHQTLVGFAAFTGAWSEAQEAALWAKLERKGVQALVANAVDAEGTGFGADDNEAQLLLASNHSVAPLPRASKPLFARQLLTTLLAAAAPHDSSATPCAIPDAPLG